MIVLFILSIIMYKVKAIGLMLSVQRRYSLNGMI